MPCQFVTHCPISSILTFPEANLKTVYNNSFIQVMWPSFQTNIYLPGYIPSNTETVGGKKPEWSSFDTLCPKLKTILIILQS